MNATLRTLCAASLLAGGTASADVICDNCIAPTTLALPYVGAYWPGDRGTFRTENPAAPPGHPFDRSYAFDVNDTGRLQLTVVGTELTNVRVELYDGSGSLCGPLPGDSCSQIVFQPGDGSMLYCSHPIEGACVQLINPYPALTGTDKRRASVILPVVPGRYSMRVILRKATVEGSYAVTVAVRK